MNFILKKLYFHENIDSYTMNLIGVKNTEIIKENNQCFNLAEIVLKKIPKIHHCNLWGAS